MHKSQQSLLRKVVGFGGASRDPDAYRGFVPGPHWRTSVPPDLLLLLPSGKFFIDTRLTCQTSPLGILRFVNSDGVPQKLQLLKLQHPGQQSKWLFRAVCPLIWGHFSRSPSSLPATSVHLCRHKTSQMSFTSLKRYLK